MIQTILINRANYTLDERERLMKTDGPDDREPQVLLATCNRTETYWGQGEIPADVARHLFRVAAGLESSLIGERAIQGQLKQAYYDAKEHYQLPSALNRLFQSAIHVGKRVRTETQIAAGAVSHGQVTVEMLRHHNIDLKNKVVGIIGVNRLTEDILKYLTARGAVNLYLSNRHLDKAQAIAAQYGAKAMPLDLKHRLLGLCDVLISATSAPHALIHPSDFPEDSERNILMFDLAFPRDIEPAVGEMPGVTLYNLDDIERFARHNLSLRLQEVSHAEAIINDELDKLMKWQEFALRLAKTPGASTSNDRPEY
jgi:glutamyl-tRNA reductase